MMCVSGGRSVHRRTCSLEMLALKHHWSNMFRLLMSYQVVDHVSAAYRMTGRMRTRQSHNLVGREIEECQILRSREAILLCAIAIHFLMSCSVDPVLWMSTPRYMNDSMISTLSLATGTRSQREGRRCQQFESSSKLGCQEIWLWDSLSQLPTLVLIASRSGGQHLRRNQDQ